MPPSGPGARANALEIFASWLTRHENGENVEFDELLRAHPHLAAELADLEATWQRLAAAGDSAQSSVPAPFEIFAGWLARREEGHEEAFEKLLQAHAGRAAELNRMYADWKRAQRALGRPGARGDADQGSLTERLQTRFGEGIDPKVDLRGSAAQAETFSSEVIQRLAGRSGSFGRYQLEGEIARGGMGAILKIWDEDLRRHLAMKVILGQAEAPSSSATPPVETKKIARFLEEAQVTGQLDHPGIVPVHELGLDTDGRLYFTMKLVKGSSLKEVFDQVAEGRGGWTQTKALGVLLKVCEAMAYAHDKGVIHRDLKPANIMVGKFGEVHVMDWGLARILDKEDEKDIRIRGDTQQLSSLLLSDRGEQRAQTPESPLYTMDGDVVGTPAYMPLEQAAGKASEVGPHSDVYALGAMLYHLLAGHMPYVPKGALLNNYAVWGLVQQGPPTSIVQLSPETSAELIAICEKAMARDWRQRYRDMSELAADLSAYLEHRVVGAYQTGTWAEAKKWIERNKPLAASLAAAIAILVAGIIGTTTFAVDAKQQSTRADAQADEAKRLAAAEAEARRDADLNAEKARHNAAVAQQNEARAVEQERIAARRTNDVLSLSAIQDLEELIARADKLWPAHPENISRYEEWLSDARTLIGGRPGDESKGQRGRPGLAALQKQLSEIEQRALPQTESERASERDSHPRAGELAELRGETEWMARMLGKLPWPSESEEQASIDHLAPAPADAKAWNSIAWTLVRQDRESYGGEVKALLCARRAVEGAQAEERHTYRDTLAWALFRVGRFDEAVEQEKKSLEEAPEQDRKAGEDSFKNLESILETWRTPSGERRLAQEQRFSELETKVAELERVISSSLEWNFANSEDRWWHLQLAKLVANLESSPIRRLAYCPRAPRTYTAGEWRSASSSRGPSRRGP